MQPCCELTYKKYLIDDGDAVYLHEGLLHEAIEKTEKERQVRLELEEVCLCDCHIKGIVVLH